MRCVRALLHDRAGLACLLFLGIVLLAMFVFCVNVFKRRYLDGLPDRELFQPGGRSGG